MKKKSKRAATPRTLANLRPELQAMLCAHEAFRRLGFPPEDIFVAVAVDPTIGPMPLVFVVLVRRGVHFNVRVCPLWCKEKSMHAQWHVAVTLWNDPSHVGGCKELWDASDARATFVELTAAVCGKGIPLPVGAVFAKDVN